MAEDTRQEHQLPQGADRTLMGPAEAEVTCLCCGTQGKVTPVDADGRLPPVVDLTQTSSGAGKDQHPTPLPWRRVLCSNGCGALIGFLCPNPSCAQQLGGQTFLCAIHATLTKLTADSSKTASSGADGNSPNDPAWIF